MRRWTKCAAAAACVSLVATASAEAKDNARYILPPGNFGGLPTTANSRDQLPLYNGLTPLRRNVSAADVNRLFLPANFKPIGKQTFEKTGRPGLILSYDSYGIPHVYGKTRDDVSFGAGWTSARDRGLLLSLGRGAARAAVADVPGVDAFGLVTSGQTLKPSAQSEALIERQKRLMVKVLGAKGREILRDSQSYVDGVNAYQRSKGQQGDFTVNDVVATTAFIGSIFGAGGGGEADNGDLLARLQKRYGAKQGKARWSDVMLMNDPEAPTTIRERFDYPVYTGGKVTGSITPDAGSLEPFTPDAVKSNTASASATAAPPRRRASNFQIATPKRSATNNTLAVMGPQLGYFYPEIVQQIDMHGPGLNAQGAAVPGLAMYILLGRTKNYAWSLTSAGQDVRDVYAEQLCEPGGGRATRASTGYRYKGRCVAMKDFTAGTLGGKPLSFKTTVHGGVIGTGTVKGRPYAFARKRSTFGRDGLNLAALKDMTEGKGGSAKRFYKAANQFGFTFNWGYANRRGTAYFASGYLPKRPRGLDRRLPTLGTGKYEWRGFLDQDQHPHATSGPDGLLLNWNNRSAPGFVHGDDEPYGSNQRVELFNRFKGRNRLEDVVGVMNRAATEDLRQPVWPYVSDVLATGKAPSARAAAVKRLLDGWVKRDAPRVDANNDSKFDESGPTIMDELWPEVTTAVMRPRFGPVIEQLDEVRGLNSQAANSYVDKDLRTLLGRKVRGEFNVRYCGRGNLRACRSSLWRTVDSVGAKLAKQYGGDDPARWIGPGSRTRFVPGLIPDTFPTTNRPTFQQALEFDR